MSIITLCLIKLFIWSLIVVLFGDLMSNMIDKGKIEFENGNYLEALGYFEQVGEDDEHYRYAQLFKANCLIELEKYEDSLQVVDSLISAEPYHKLAWFNKVLCHILLKDEKEAFKTLDHLMNLIDFKNKHDLVFIAKLYKLLGDYDNALKYCDAALEIDEYFKDALYEKSFAALRIDDDEAIKDVSDKLYQISNDDLFRLMPVFLLKLFSKDYRGCRDLINNSKRGEFEDEHINILKGAVYNQICDDFCINLLIVNGEDLPIDDALDAMLDFVENGRDNGKIGKIQYFII